MRTGFEIRNRRRSIPPLTVGNGRPAIIVIVGVTDGAKAASDEVAKSLAAVKYGAHMVGDVSTEGDIGALHRQLVDTVPVPLNSVPFYEIFNRACKRGLWGKALPKSLILETIEEQAERGIDCMTVHASFSRTESLLIESSPRRIKIQARGGGLLHEYMQRTGDENPLLELYDDILDIASAHGVTISLGSSLRPGTVADSVDRFLQSETMTQSELGVRANEHGVNCMVEGVSHLRYNLIPAYVRWTKVLCGGLPLRLLGPLGTERGLGYDHITAAITAASAVSAGVDLLTCVTRAEHIGLPDEEEIREAIVALRIAIELATQGEAEQEQHTSFRCGLGFYLHSPDDFIDFSKAHELKLKKGGDLGICTMCNRSCRMVASKVTGDGGL
jgi:phosphomethylpyrimidine synthase